jgi:hypothetical protein
MGNLKERIQALDRDIDRYEVVVISKIKEDVRQVVDPQSLCVGDAETAETVQKNLVQKAVNEGTLDPNQYLEMVREELPEGAYQERVLRNVGRVLERNYFFQ